MKAKKLHYLAIGEYNNGTLRPIDLLDTLAYELSKVKLTRQERSKVNRALSLVKKYDEYTDDSYDIKYAELYDELTYIADNHTAPYTYYGSIEGDGACIGVWIDRECINAAIYDDELISVDDTPKGYNGLAIDINDHGNATLYKYSNGRRREVWAIV